MFGGAARGNQFYFQQIEEQANRQAQAMTAEYFKQVKAQAAASQQVVVVVGGKQPQSEEPNNKPNKIEENQEKVFIVYKFIQTPIDAIITGM